MKLEDNFATYRNEIYVQKYMDKKQYIFRDNYNINIKDLKDKYNQKKGSKCV